VLLREPKVALNKAVALSDGSAASISNRRDLAKTLPSLTSVDLKTSAGGLCENEVIAFCKGNRPAWVKWLNENGLSEKGKDLYGMMI
jgi:hypothetical protein